MCVRFMEWLQGSPSVELNPEAVEETDEMLPATRQCLNSKSRTHPDVQCPLAANHGDYCYRHYKNPRPFTAFGRASEDAVAADAATAASRIQRAWRKAAPLLRWRAQGPAANCLDLATNPNELYSFDPLSSIPRVYLFSFADSRRAVWVFDIRTLAHAMGAGFPSMNPYTRETLPAAALSRLQTRVGWLRARGYQIQHINSDELTPEQLWNQRVLDLILKIEALGYYANTEWIHNLSKVQLIVLYKKLEDLWNWRLGLTPLQKETIVPGHAGPDGNRLFAFIAEDHFHKHRNWWLRQLVGVCEAFVSRGATAEQHKLGAMYVLMGLVQVCREAAVALPWAFELVV